jgi:hypothetical protein
LFVDIQGKVKQLDEKFPIIKGLLGNILIPLHIAALIFCYAMMQWYYSLLCNITFPMDSLAATVLPHPYNYAYPSLQAPLSGRNQRTL